MAWNTRVQYPNTGVGPYNLGFPYLAKSDVYVFLDDTLVPSSSYTFNLPGQITMNSPMVGTTFTFKRMTDSTVIRNLSLGSTPSTAELNQILLRVQYLVQEAVDAANEGALAQTGSGSWDALNQKLINLASGVNPSDAVNKSQLDGKQPLDATLTALAGVVTVANKVIYATGSDTFTTADLTTFGRSVIATANAAALLSLLGTGSLALLNAVNNSNWSGTALSIANGGTGQTTRNAALNALVPAQSGATAGQVLASNGTDISFISVGGIGTVTSITAGGMLSATPNPITSSGTISVNAASVGDVLSGTSTGVAATPDAIAGLWEQGTSFTVNSGTTTLNIPSSGGGYFNINGTGNPIITAINQGTAPRAGRRIQFRATTPFTLTHNPTSLILPNGGLDINVEVGDTFSATMIDAASNYWVVTDYQRASGIPLAANGSIVSYKVATNQQYLVSDFLDSSKYRYFTVQLIDVLPVSASNQLNMQMSTDGGASYLATGTSYDKNGVTWGPGDLVNYVSGQGSSIELSDPAATAGNTAPACGFKSVQFSLNDLASSGYKEVQFKGSYGNNSGVPCTSDMTGWLRSTSVATNFRLFFTTGNIASGQMIVRGWY